MKRKMMFFSMIVLLAGVNAVPPAAMAQSEENTKEEVVTPEKPLTEVYTEEERMAIFKEIGAAEDKAAAEVAPAYAAGPVEAAVKLQQTLQRKYVTVVLEKYKITPAQEVELYVEALTKQWAAERI